MPNFQSVSSAGWYTIGVTGFDLQQCSRIQVAPMPVAVDPIMAAPVIDQGVVIAVLVVILLISLGRQLLSILWHQSNR